MSDVNKFLAPDERKLLEKSQELASVIVNKMMELHEANSNAITFCKELGSSLSLPKALCVAAIGHSLCTQYEYFKENQMMLKEAIKGSISLLENMYEKTKDESLKNMITIMNEAVQ